MTEPFSHPIVASDFRASAAREEEAIRLALTGSADLTSREALEHALAALDREALRAAVVSVVIDLRGLRFLNSSCLKSFISWISLVLERPPGKRYAIRFVSNPELAWQRRSLDAIRCFADTLITIEEER